MSNEEKTGDLPGARPFEERVLSAIAEMRADFNSRLEKLEAKSYDTKPIWEQALIGIMEVRRAVERMDVRLDRIESEVKGTHSELYTLRADFKEFRAGAKEPA